jgi:hypothetical protein
MKYIITLIATFALGTVFADSPHFIGAPTAEFDSTNGDYCATFKEAGLGNLPITYTLTAGLEVFTFQCFTRSGNEPQGEPNNISFSNQSVQTTITPHNGQTHGTLCLFPQQDGADCQGHGLVLRFIHALYQTVTICDSNNNVCATLPDLSGDIQH